MKKTGGIEMKKTGGIEMTEPTADAFIDRYNELKVAIIELQQKIAYDTRHYETRLRTACRMIDELRAENELLKS